LELEAALADGIAREMVTEEELEEALGRLPSNHPGAARIRALLRLDSGTIRTRSDGERVLRRLLREAGLPQPASNVRFGECILDLYWPDLRLVVELDGFPGHRSRAKFESDRRRDQVLAAAGIQTLRITGRQLESEPLAVIARLAMAMAIRLPDAA
jgi:very-short-patch-repair endonuclease